MSFGLEIDFLAVAGLVKQIRKSFVGAPEQFKAISDDIRAFSIILHDIEVNCTELGPEQSQEYQSVVASCKRLLVQLKRTLEEYSGVAKGDKTGKRTAIKRVWNRLKWEPDDIRDIRSQISVKIDTLRSLNDQVTSHNIVKLIRHQENTEREATIKWISDINYIAQQNDIFLRCQTGSRKWLFESEIYLEWLRRKGSLLFCPGNAGTGKTFTTAMVVESLRLANDAETLTTYMYCSYQNHTQTIEKLLCSLLRVAFEEADYEADGAVSACKQLRLSNKSISRQHCLTLLQGLFSRFTRVNLIVDALDELPNEVRRPLIYDLLKLHEHPNVSLFVTSRGIPEIQHFFEDCENYTSLEVRSSDEDIRDFLRDNIFQLPNFVARSQKLQDEVIDSVTDASAGMFLLAELYLKSLANIILVGSLRTRLSNLATGSNTYDTLYEGSMLRIGFQGPELEHIAIQMLLVLTCARRPLSSQELSHALSIDESSEDFDEDMIPDMDDLVAACTGLVVLDDTSHIVHLVHKSASEYFERTRTRWFPSANEKMAFICLRYLQIAEKEPEETRGDKAPFFYYAKANWCYHSMENWQLFSSLSSK
ncbi:NACHT domain-containing protein [Trichoderma breve]|uniref:NACHT domain-containing protein n=1 Tax=Trichoderma breve TaxID=2034170 RepID=A0A9W9B4F5_9HYPO|nr:NACHT domain-containing protein [Trichoderma breve]KAJ4855497.1 NACHT domain-containing protein [Trichoderma breve]